MTAVPGPDGVVIEGLVKRYGDTVALAGLNLAARSGEILGIAGPNGAGKSTLVKVLAGEVTPDAGTITVQGRPWSPQLGASRIAIVHQEPQLFPNLTVAENLLAGREGSRGGRPRLAPADVDMLRETDLLPFADHLLGDLPLALQQRTEIARALVRNADVFLFDEPNSALTEDESAELFARMHTIADSGRVVFLVTHRLAELAAHADRVAMIVDGSCAMVLAPPELTEERIARELVVGRAAVTRDDRADSRRDAVPLLALTGWTHHRAKFVDVTMQLGRGDIVAVVGVEGSGGRELVRSVAGFERTHGDATLAGRPVRSGGDVAFVAADRADSLFDNLSVGENLYIRQGPAIRRRLGLLKRSAATRLARQARSDFLVKTASLDTPIRALSGGNQQKVAIAAALALAPPVVVLEEPTRGVDISSKAEIYRLLRGFADAGGAVLLYCTEDSEVFDVADRAVVISAGRVAGELDCTEFSDAEMLAERIALLTAAIPVVGGSTHQSTGDAA
ncbi:ATP-binding cassette domain-containing protein [Micromonospora echinofusca]|uniref:ATP-binding cassette domain-containing protein n=1 Tax=Micromonospora echinofusca TaxID=47858 RepID=A0ABS3W032_MICEH|nr:sugar ABC transporter ATP-binding protein [Micromonospora echinofusca]MBO4210165.1 ATP-binding cassette domain-containing protein [Micromonospora echinofusca]